MGTTDARLACASLEGMKEAGARFALLHGRERLLEGIVSDIDMVVGEHPTAVVQRSAAVWGSRGLMPVMVWPYDVGGTATVFLATPDATEGVQLDLLYDLNGIGRYGVKSPPLLSTADSSEAIPSVSDAASLIYQWQKRTVKRDEARLAALTELANGMDRRALLLASEAITGSRDPACRMLEGRPVFLRPRFNRHLGRRGIRLVRRVARPVGFWAHASESAIGAGLTSLFSRFLVRARTQPTPSVLRQPAWWLTSIQPIRLRPALIVSTGKLARWGTPDVVLGAPSTVGAARQLTAAMAARFESTEPRRPIDANDNCT
jgi:hypothetical protein